ncbi:MAG TPA: RHS repeat-associated core domain-containing protein, partial [Dehalococcoidia bacterium]|nr:RHS repeat-associated core domain-containing protein [Dehalococcoidia bacterium]
GAQESYSFSGMFAGEDIDPDTGLTYQWNRWRSEDGSRFISEDPIQDGTNYYAYAANSPLCYTDPWGLDVGFEGHEGSNEQAAAQGGQPGGEHGGGNGGGYHLETRTESLYTTTGYAGRITYSVMVKDNPSTQATNNAGGNAAAPYDPGTSSVAGTPISPSSSQNPSSGNHSGHGGGGNGSSISSQSTRTIPQLIAQGAVQSWNNAVTAANAVSQFIFGKDVGEAADEVVMALGPLAGTEEAISQAIAAAKSLPSAFRALIPAERSEAAAVSPGAIDLQWFASRINIGSLKELKQLVQELSKPGSKLSQQELDELRGLVDEYGGTLRLDLEGVKGSGVPPHAHIEGLGSKVKSRHIWLEDGVQ